MEYCGEDFLIEVRFSGTEYVEGGYTLKEGVEFAKLMDGKADLLHVSACNFYFPETECLMVPGMFKEEGHNLYLAEEIKKHVKHSHVVSVGAHRDPKKIEDILAAGKVDMIAVCRAVNADPQFVNKLKRNQEEEIRPCLRCNACIANYQTRITKCAINPTLDRPEDEVELTDFRGETGKALRLGIYVVGRVGIGIVGGLRVQLLTDTQQRGGVPDLLTVLEAGLSGAHEVNELLGVLLVVSDSFFF